MSDQSSEGLLSPFLQRMRINMAIPHMEGSVLDIGCGNGMLASYVEPHNYYGFDIQPDILRIANKRFAEHHFSNDMPADRKFDCIVLLAVIEHLDHPIEYLENLISYLNPNGKIIITTPHPVGDTIHDIGANLRLFSKEAHEEHKLLLDHKLFEGLLKDSRLKINEYKRFLFFMNQLFVLELR